MGGVKLYDLNMQEVELRGVKWLEFTPDAPTADRSVEKVYNGDIPMGKTRNSRLIQAKLWYKAYDAFDFKLLRDELFAFLSPHKELYAVDDDVPGKRWKVEVNDIQIERINRTIAEVAVVFYCARGIAESVNTTLDAFTVDADWASGMGLEADSVKQDYTHDYEFFTIHNAGTEVVDPRESELTITITAPNGGDGSVKLTNNTTQEQWTYTGPLNAGDTLTIDCMESKRNAANIVGLTNLNLISLAPGDNSFKLTGINQGYEIAFNFRYLYL